MLSGRDRFGKAPDLSPLPEVPRADRVDVCARLTRGENEEGSVAYSFNSFAHSLNSAVFSSDTSQYVMPDLVHWIRLYPCLVH